MMKTKIGAAPPPLAEEMLRIQFRKSLRRGFTRNADMDPVAAEGITGILEPEETLVVRVVSTNGQHYWFSDRRLLWEYDGGSHERLRYGSVIKAHWMFKDFWTVRRKLLQSNDEAAQFKASHFDRLEIELQDRVVVLDGLNQAYWPILHFFWWVARASTQPRP